MSLITDKIESLNSDNEEQQNMKVQLQTLAQLAASQNDANRISLENNLQSGEVAGGGADALHKSAWYIPKNIYRYK